MFTHLQNKCFHIRSQYNFEIDQATGQASRKRLEQLFFMTDEQISLGQQFCSSFMLEINSTFNTNTLKLPLTILTGVSNTGKSFPLAFSFAPSENKDSMDFK